ncbi:MAG: hypothetical protein ACTH2Y_12945 [Corynebacterium sp.]|uniref:hypothetical protein n=1 Tax=unclassified Corynebacterium TaxID=2624378 RepID=UPI0026487696|nr:hypothetical protein [Corynebacterium sp.]MDN5720553.1 hypothetical protein [Corynebacterium sp.]MDN6509904.1 hypothetical protein [Corynebacterium sp.]
MFESQDNRMPTTTMIRFARTDDARDERLTPVYTSRPGVRRSTAVTYREGNPTRLEKRRSRVFAEDPFRARFGHRLPAGMRQEARGMEWRKFVATYAPATYRVESMTTTRRPAGRRCFDITLTGLREDAGTQVSITSMGAASAMTQILADHGRRVEILEFHQYDIFEATVTFVFAQHETKKVWAVGFGADRDLSIASALTSAAGRLHG